MALRNSFFDDEQLKRPKRWIYDYIARHPTKTMRKVQMQTLLAAAFSRTAEWQAAKPTLMEQLVSVQPLPLPTAPVFYMDLVYGPTSRVSVRRGD